MIIDAFPGNFEVSLAELRIEYLSPLVDMTLIAESKLSHSGKKKPLYFSEWLANHPSEHMRSRVKIVEVDLSKFSDSWSREIATREAIVDYAVKNFPNSTYILSDLDEFPSLSQVERAHHLGATFHFLTPTVYLFANWHLRDTHRNWNKGIISSTKVLPGPNGGRFGKFQTISDNCGLHLSWLSEDKVSQRRKVDSGAHEELRIASIPIQEIIEFSRKYGVDHLGRFGSKSMGILEIRSEADLMEIQRFIFKRNPDLFRFEIEVSALFCRLIASLICTAIWHRPKFRFFIIEQLLRGNKSIKNLVLASSGLFVQFCVSLRSIIGLRAKTSLRKVLGFFKRN